MKKKISRETAAFLGKAYDAFIKNNDYDSAYAFMSWLWESNQLTNLLLRNFAISAVLSKNGERCFEQISSVVDTYPDRYYICNVLAGLSGSLGKDDISREFALKMCEIKALTKSVKIKPALRVLVLQTIASGAYKLSKNGFHISEGHNNLQSLLDDQVARSILRVDNVKTALAEVSAADYDLVFNNITDPERCWDALTNAEEICNVLQLPVFNHPALVKAASREGNYLKFKDSTDVIVPKSVKIDKVKDNIKDKVRKQIKEQGLRYPIIVRISGFQAGKFMSVVHDIDTHDFSLLESELKKAARDLYMIEYHDIGFKDARVEDDTLYSKYRAFMVNGTLYPVHLFVAKNNYNVHRNNSSAFMKDNEWLIDMEKQYCDNPQKHIGSELWLALQTLLQQTGLDYQGVDFSVSTENNSKKLIVFEINAAMRNSMRSLADRPHTQQAWRQITLRAHEAMCEKSHIAEWGFTLKN